MVGVLAGEGCADVGPMVAQRRRQLLLGCHDQLRVRLDQVEQGAEALDRQQLGDIGAPLVARGAVALGGAESACRGGDLGQLSVLGGKLGGGRDLDLGDIAERALGERREPAQRFDLDVEHVHPHRVLLGGGEHVEQASPHRELAALLDLVDALVAGADEVVSALVEVEQLADSQRERAWAQGRVGHLLREGHG